MPSNDQGKSTKRIPSSRPPTLEELAAKTNSSSSATGSPDAGVGQQAGGTEGLVEGVAGIALNGTDHEKKSTSDDSGSADPAIREKDKAPRGYKNIPSLDAIAGRLARTRTETASSTASSDKDGSSAAMTKTSSAPDTATSPELEEGEVEESSDNGTQGGEGHPLQHTW
ncbi:hypothetical protein FRB90_008285 [Tulasnella sp. 427]|nr:hypothetical protein FRB90_008285 [Tulasnella sp. 427]